MRWVRIIFLPVSLVVLFSAALIVPLPRFVERPGQILSLNDCVTVGEERTSVAGDFLLTTVNVRQATIADMVVAAVRPDSRIEKPEAVIPPGMGTGDYFRLQRQNFRLSADVAAAIGLRAAGISAEVSGDGAQVVRVLEGGPSEQLLQPGDVIVAVESARVRTEVDLRRAVAKGQEGQPLELAVVRNRKHLTVDVVPVILEGQLIIGVLPQTANPTVSLPIGVDVRSGPVGGPSAGLMIALTVFDKQSEDVDLAAGRIVAGTGTIDMEGRVGTVGGVDLKVLAAQRQGATLFLVPRADAAAAKEVLSEDANIQVVAVDTFDDAREALLQTAPETPAKSDGAGACPYGTTA
jgi:PDZ domain-containing protein